MEQKKITKRDYFGMVKAIVEIAEVENRDELVAFIDHEVDLLAKKSASRSKADLVKAEGNAVLLAKAIAILEGGKALTVTEIMKADADLAEFSNQKISAILNGGVAEGTLKKVTDKGKSLFRLA